MKEIQKVPKKYTSSVLIYFFKVTLHTQLYSILCTTTWDTVRPWHSNICFELNDPGQEIRYSRWQLKIVHILILTSVTIKKWISDCSHLNTISYFFICNRKQDQQLELYDVQKFWIMFIFLNSVAKVDFIPVPPKPD